MAALEELQAYMTEEQAERFKRAKRVASYLHAIRRQKQRRMGEHADDNLDRNASQFDDNMLQHSGDETCTLSRRSRASSASDCKTDTQWQKLQDSEEERDLRRYPRGAARKEWGGSRV